MKPVIEILRKNREQAIDDLVASLIEVVPRYALVSNAGEVRASVNFLFDEFLRVIETGVTDKLTEELTKLARKRIDQGFAAADFVRALLMTYPVVRTLVRKEGPKNDAAFSRMFEDVENAVVHIIGLASNIFAAGVTRHANAKLGALQSANEELRESERALEAAADVQKRRLREAEELNARVIQSLSSGVAVIREGTLEVLLWSPRMAEITGVDTDTALGRPVDEVMKDFTGLPLQELLATVRATDRLPMTKIQLGLPGGGPTRALFLRGERLFGDDQSVRGSVVIVDDITEREMLIDSFSRYVSKEVVHHILSRGGRSGRLEGERRECSILFADIRGFTGISERITPEALHELLNQYFRVMIEQVSANDGLIDKFIGDKIMAIFTGSEAEGARSAVKAAAAIQEEIQKLNTLRQSGGAEPITVGIGVNTGTVVMGTVGSEERMSFTVIGDAVNVADRLQALAGAGEICVGARTRELTKDTMQFDEMGERVLKGRSSPEMMFRWRAR